MITKQCDDNVDTDDAHGDDGDGDKTERKTNKTVFQDSLASSVWSPVQQVISSCGWPQ